MLGASDEPRQDPGGYGPQYTMVETDPVFLRRWVYKNYVFTLLLFLLLVVVCL